ncbi:hypothetical protein MW887_011521 [Aspergillus wentii]|nr:hypothetical protein MW887_011521 [Aspergillus wentii]
MDPVRAKRQLPDSIEPADISQSASRRWKWSANVMLIGTSQSGKSLLVNRFRSLAVGPYPLQESPETGVGTTSCTRDPVMYEFDVPMTSYSLVDATKASEVDVPEDEESIFKWGFWKKKDLTLSPRNPDAELVRVRLFDTPGLDDSNPERNCENIQKVLQYLAKSAEDSNLDHRHLSSVIFVIKSGASFTDSLQKWYFYYQRCMPNLFGSIAVINTNFRLKDWKTEYTKTAVNMVSFRGAGPSSRDSKMKNRREAWADIFHCDPPHFFIDSKPNPKNAFEEFTSANTVYDILLYLRSQGKLPIENVHLIKFPDMLSIDTKLVGCLYDVGQIWNEERDFHMMSMTTNQKSLYIHERNVLTWENELKELDGKLSEWDSDVQWDLGTYSPKDDISTPNKIWKIVTFSHFENSLTITEKVYPFQVNAADTDDAVWVSKKLPTIQTKTWKGQYKSKWGKVPRFSVRSYTTNRTHFAEEIEAAEKRKDVLIDDIGETKEIIAHQADVIARSENPRVEQLTTWLARSEPLIKQLQDEEVPLYEGFNQSARRRYAKSIDKIGYDDLISFVEEVAPSLKSVLAVALNKIDHN